MTIFSGPVRTMCFLDQTVTPGTPVSTGPAADKVWVVEFISVYIGSYISVTSVFFESNDSGGTWEFATADPLEGGFGQSIVKQVFPGNVATPGFTVRVSNNADIRVNGYELTLP